jgi:hypothetical protein
MGMFAFNRWRSEADQDESQGLLEVSDAESKAVSEPGVAEADQDESQGLLEVSDAESKAASESKAKKTKS